MSDDTDDRTLATSAYLDNEATPDERALIDADTSLQAEVASLGQVRTVLGATAPQPSLANREAHLAAALDVFDRMSDLERTGEVTPASGVDAAAAAALSTPLSSSDTGRHRRPERESSRSTWLLSAAAALLVLAGVGAVVANVITSDNSDDATSEAVVGADASDAASEPESVEALEADEVLDRADDPLVDPDTIGDYDVFGEDDGFDAAESTEASDDIAMDGGDDGALEDSDDGDGTSDAPGEPPVDEEVPAPPPEVPLTPLLNDDDLAAFATLAVPAIGPDGEFDPADVDYEPPADSCEARFTVQKRAGFANYKGQTVMVGIDLDQRIVYAYTDDDCQLIGQTQLPDVPRDVAEPAATQP